MALIDYKKYSSEIKTLLGAFTLAGMWYDLKTDYAVHKESHKLIEYRISSLENKIAIKSNNTTAIMPRGTEIETENKNRR